MRVNLTSVQSAVLCIYVRGLCFTNISLSLLCFESHACTYLSDNWQINQFHFFHHFLVKWYTVVWKGKSIQQSAQNHVSCLRAGLITTFTQSPILKAWLQQSAQTLSPCQLFVHWLTTFTQPPILKAWFVCWQKKNSVKNEAILMVVLVYGADSCFISLRSGLHTYLPVIAKKDSLWTAKNW